ncbi:nitroreductase family protein [Methylomonas rosea]|uniref:Nitroreductase family protein n=1 Tax=Methylomonas rosea TaxID=2952227 RepID=A0ABT1TY57_9GAMM|nr:nitroreductase family protein [Methylomonas sp. WSC-7]MCQ8119706.1 nitroreductase family protein [Methylomonas sp. WSC-7]
MFIKDLMNVLIIPYEYALDFFRALKWSKASPLCPKYKQLHYDILLLAHTVEKGLSISNPRPKFGVDKISKLLNYLEQYSSEWDSFPLEKSYGCLQSYVRWHKDRDIALEGFGLKIEKFLSRCEDLNIEPKGGVKEISNSSVQLNVEAERFLNSRFSCRRFLPGIVEDSILEKIAEIARRTPSQCNRQSGRIHYYSEPEDISKLLRLQGGAEGFRESVNNLFVISSEISAWSGFKARSQAYVDGALLAMQVLNACQALGLGACPLNLAVSNNRELDICKVGRISVGERLIVMIAFGLPEPIDLVVARSERMPIDKVIIKH